MARTAPNPGQTSVKRKAGSSTAAELLLDTHVLVWLMTGEARIGSALRRSIDQAATSRRVWVSAITPWEIAMLVAKQRLRLDRDVMAWVDEALARPGLRLAALEPSITVASTRLPGELHADPADRLIVATARHLGATLVTADVALLAYAEAGHLSALAV